MTSPFAPDNPGAYRHWRAQKLALAASTISELTLQLESASGPNQLELARIQDACRRANMVLIQLPPTFTANPRQLQRLGPALGLQRLDQNLCADDAGISAIEVADQRRPNEYIPYTDRPLSWHTDGYYNQPERQIRAWSLLCVRPAASGGENQLLDHEIAYLLLRDEDPRLIQALMAPDAMTIPANLEAGREIRPARSGPVFSIAGDGSLHMRYSARQRNIHWKPGPARAAAEFLQGLFSSGSPHILRHRLEPGEVLVSNNVLHNRSGFQDRPEPQQRRLLYRARYFDRIAGTAPPFPYTQATDTETLC